MLTSISKYKNRLQAIELLNGYDEYLGEVSKELSSFLEAIADGLDGTLPSLTDTQLVLDDGSVFVFKQTDNSLSTITASGATATLWSPESGFADVITDYHGVSHQLGDVVKRVSLAVTDNEVVHRAINVVSNGAFSVSDFAAICSDLADNGGLANSEAYAIIINSMKDGNPTTLLHLLSALKGTMGSAAVGSEDNIAFQWASADYRVNTGVISVIGSSFVSLASIALALVSKVGAIIGFVVSLVGSAIANKFSESTNATVNYEALDKVFASPIFQLQVDSRNFRVPDVVVNAVSEYGIAKFVIPGAVVYVWKNVYADSIYATTHYCFEGFLDLTRTEDALEGSGQPDIWEPSDLSDTNVHSLVTSFARFDDYVAAYNAVTDQCNANSYTDDQLLNRCYNAAQSVLRWLVSAIPSSSAPYYEVFISPTSRVEVLSGDSTSSINPDLWGYDGNNERVLPWSVAKLIWRITGNNNEKSWANLTNNICPTLRSMFASGASYWAYFYAGLKNVLENYSDLIVVTTKTQEPFVTPPRWDRSALILGTVMSAVIATAAAATALAARRVIKRRVSRVSGDAYLRAQQAAANYYNNPTSANWEAYYKANRKYRQVASFFGGTSLNPVNSAISASADGSNVTPLVTSAINALDSYTRQTNQQLLEKLDQILAAIIQ